MKQPMKYLLLRAKPYFPNTYELEQFDSIAELSKEVLEDGIEHAIVAQRISLKVEAIEWTGPTTTELEAVADVAYLESAV